jgi:hypothetical protein
MALSLDPAENPILQVYELFSRSGLQPRDKADFLGFWKLKLQEITSARARELITLLRKTIDAVNHFELQLNRQRLIDFAPESVAEWLDRQTIDELSDQLCANCSEALASVRDDMDAYKDEAGLDKDELEAESLELLDLLADCPACGNKFELDVKLDKNVLIQRYLFESKPGVSTALWYDGEHFRNSFDSFESLLDFAKQKAEKPIIVFLYQPAEIYHGDYFKIFSLNGGDANFKRREQELRDTLNTFSAQVLNDYELLRLKHSNEHRPKERLDLPPSLFLRRKDVLAQYPSHPLFLGGPIRSVLVYAVMAWLAEKSGLDESVAHFTLSPGPGATPLTLNFSLADVLQEKNSIFDTKDDWTAVLALVGREIGFSVGSEKLRTYWQNGLKDKTAEDFSAPSFFSSLKAVYVSFREQKDKPIELARTSPRFIEILVRLDPEHKELRFELDGQGYLHKPVGGVSLSASESDLRTAELSKLARQYLERTMEPDPKTGIVEPAMHNLKTQGVDLWLNFIPEQLKRAYAILRAEDLTIFIVSDDPSFPWELVKPVQLTSDFSPQGFTDLWWAVEFSIARWLSGRNPPASELALNRVCCVADDQLTAAAMERDYLKSLGTVCDLPQTWTDLINLLSTKDYDLIHFACHGNFAKRDPGESVALMPDGRPLIPKHFLDEGIMSKFKANHPLVFLNSCHSGRTGQTLIGIEGWAREFIDRECGAFIGCGWEVHDELAADFAVTFYEKFRGGMSLGKAVHKARRHIMNKAQQNSTWLAYYLYGNPNCILRSGS